MIFLHTIENNIAKDNNALIA